MEYKKAVLLPNDVYLVDMRFIKEAHNKASNTWKDVIIECVESTIALHIMNDLVEVKKSIILDALKDESICESWKEKIKEVFEPKSEYYKFDYNGHELGTISRGIPMFINNDLVPKERLECVLIDLHQWEVHQEEINVYGASSYLKLKFKKK